jgi:hypothetical protein
LRRLDQSAQKKKSEKNKNSILKKSDKENLATKRRRHHQPYKVGEDVSDVVLAVLVPRVEPLLQVRQQLV